MRSTVGWVEDQPDKVSACYIALRRMGVDIVPFTSRTAAESFFARGGRVDVMIFDLLIPSGSESPEVPSAVPGLAVIRSLAASHLPAAKCLVLTVLHDPAVHAELKSYGIPQEQILTKDIAPEQFAEEVLRVLGGGLE